MSTFTPWVEKVIIFCVISIGIDLVNVIVFTESWDHFFGRGRAGDLFTVREFQIFLVAVFSYGSVIM